MHTRIGIWSDQSEIQGNAPHRAVSVEQQQGLVVGSSGSGQAGSSAGGKGQAGSSRQRPAAALLLPDPDVFVFYHTGRRFSHVMMYRHVAPRSQGGLFW